MGGFASARGPQRMQTVAVSRPASWVVVLALSKESCFFSVLVSVLWSLSCFAWSGCLIASRKPFVIISLCTYVSSFGNKIQTLSLIFPFGDKIHLITLFFLSATFERRQFSKKRKCMHYTFEAHIRPRKPCGETAQARKLLYYGRPASSSPHS